MSAILRRRKPPHRRQALRKVREAGINVCCGGIVGMGETRANRAALIAQLANLDPYPESVPITALVRVKRTPLENTPKVDVWDMVRMIATAPGSGSPTVPKR